MKRKKIIKFTILMVTISMLFGACGISSSKKDKMKYEEFLVIDVFDSLANYQGIQSGWFAKVVKEKFNIELNIIAPNVAGGGDTLYQIRTAAGNVGDIIIGGGENGYFNDLGDAGLLYYIRDAL